MIHSKRAHLCEASPHPALIYNVLTVPRSLRIRWDTERRINWFHVSMIWTCSRKKEPMAAVVKV